MIPLGFTEIGSWSEGRAWVSLGGKYAYITDRGQFLTDTLYDEVHSFHEGFAVASKGEFYGLIDSNGEEKTIFIYDEMFPFRKGYSVVKKEGYWGWVDSSGYESFEPSAEAPPVRMNNGGWAIQYRGKWGVTDEKGNIVYPFEYEAILPDGKAWKNEVIYNLK